MVKRSKNLSLQVFTDVQKQLCTFEFPAATPEQHLTIARGVALCVLAAYLPTDNFRVSRKAIGSFCTVIFFLIWRIHDCLLSILHIAQLIQFLCTLMCCMFDFLLLTFQIAQLIQFLCSLHPSSG
jgi:hypothetical protein